jgi:hypothetical protein
MSVHGPLGTSDSSTKRHAVTAFSFMPSAFHGLFEAGSGRSHETSETSFEQGQACAGTSTHQHVSAREIGHDRSFLPQRQRGLLSP